MPILKDHHIMLLQCLLTKICNLFKNYYVPGDSFSPPPFPTKDANDISSDDDHSVESIDEFASKKNTKHSISGTSYVKSHSYDESDDNDDLDKSKSWRANEIGIY